MPAGGDTSPYENSGVGGENLSGEPVLIFRRLRARVVVTTVASFELFLKQEYQVGSARLAGTGTSKLGGRSISQKILAVDWRPCTALSHLLYFS